VKFIPAGSLPGGNWIAACCAQSRHKRRRSVSIALALSAFVAVRAQAQSGLQSQSSDQSQENPLKQLSLDQLGDIQVTSQTKAPVEVWKTTAAIYVITQDDIRRAGATTIAEALRLAPGVEVTRIDADKWSIGIRGFGSRLDRDVLVLMDGRSLYNPLLAGTYWEVQDTDIDDIDRIEVIRGPGGITWGPNAVNGVINIITKSAKATQGAMADGATSTFQRGFGTARYGGQNAIGSLAYRVYAKAYDRGPQHHSPGDPAYDAWRSQQAGFRADWGKSSKDSLTFQGDIYRERAGETVTAVNYAPPYQQTVEGDMRLSGGNLMLHWTHTFAEANDIQIQTYYDATNRREPNFGDIRKTFDFDYTERLPLGRRNNLTWGLGARASHGFEIQPTTGLFFTPQERTDTLYSEFVEDDIALIPNRLVVQAGSKFINTNYTGEEAEPSARLLYTPTDKQTIWLAFTRAVRTPSDAERDFNLTGLVAPPSPATDNLPVFARFEANPNFVSEKLYGYELGYRSLIRPTFYVDVATFFNHYSDLFSEDLIGPEFIETSPPPTHVLLPAHFGNGLVGDTYGGEFAPEWRPVSWWRLRGSYSYLHIVLNRGPNSQDIGSGPTTEGESPQHQVLIQSGWDLPKHFKFDFDYRYVSKLPSIKIAAYHTADARLAWTFTRRLELSANAENLFQPFHYEFASDPGPNVAIKRSYFGEVRFTSSPE
jgi:iron complex outermembrane receptor protein